MLKSYLDSNGHNLIPVTTNLIDVIWENKPCLPCNPVEPLPIHYSGICLNSCVMSN